MLPIGMPADDPAPLQLSTRKSVVRLTRAWFAAAFSREVGSHMKKATLWGVPIVLFRDVAGAASALVDRCPHRNVPLSAGKMVRGEVQCGYHGWRFDGAGRCTAIPGLPIVDDERVDAPSRCASAFAVREQDGVVWVWGEPGGTPTQDVPALPQMQDARASHVTHRARIAAPLWSVLENILDVPHTAFLHGGWFRPAKKTQRIEVEVDRRKDGVTAQYFGEERPKGLIGRLLSPGGGTMQHWDRFRLPAIAEVEYRLGDDSQIVATTLCWPAGDEVTDLLSLVSVRTRLPIGPLRFFIVPVALHILSQDRDMLEAQTRAVAAFGHEKMSSTPIDLLGPHVLHLLKKAEAGALDDAVVRTERGELWV
jgi:phenylpropionate dioxygenase-like ring-hydroxylating dioxygenase large terminal subunit